MLDRRAFFVAAGVTMGSLALPSIATAAEAPSKVYALPEPTLFPEGIGADQRTGWVYVSSQATGAIVRVNPRNGRAEQFLAPGTDGLARGNGVKVDGHGVWIAAGQGGATYLYDTKRARLIQKWAMPATGFRNDLVVTHRGTFVTDSWDPVLWRVRLGAGEAEPWLDLTTTPIVYTPGSVNLNGIVVTPDERYLIAAHSPEGSLWRIDTRTKTVVKVDLGTESIPAADGLYLDGSTLWAAQNRFGVIAKLRFSENYASAKVLSRVGDTTFRYPTTIDVLDGRMLVVNSQFDKRGAGLPPELPFTISSIAIP
jgi:Cu-Zn family superoxide dismutase